MIETWFWFFIYREPTTFIENIKNSSLLHGNVWMSIPSSDPAPGQPRVTVISSTATTIFLSWSVPSGSVVESYEVTWEREGIRSSTTIINGSTNYTIRGLELEANYTITVAASNGAGIAVSDPVTGTTGRAGSMMCVKAFTCT